LFLLEDAMLRKLTGILFAAALALAVSCSGDGDGYKKIDMPAPVDVGPGVYAVGVEMAPGSGRHTIGIWRDGAPFYFYGEDGRRRDYDDYDHFVNSIIDFCITPGYIYVLAMVNQEVCLWANGHKILQRSHQRFDGGSGCGIGCYGHDWFHGIDAKGDEWYVAGSIESSSSLTYGFPSVLWTKDHRREVNARLRAHDVFLADGAMYVVGIDANQKVDEYPRAAYWVDGAMHYLDTRPAFESLGWLPGYHSGAPSRYGLIYGGKICVSDGNVYVAGLAEGKKPGERDEAHILLWENDAPPKVLKGTKDGRRCSSPDSILVEDGDVYVFGSEWESFEEYVERFGMVWPKTHHIRRDLMWKNGGAAVPLGPDILDYASPLGEGGGAAAVSGGDVYSVGRGGGTVLKNGEALFEIKGAAAVTHLSVVE
jgi:hypothetical protein